LIACGLHAGLTLAFAVLSLICWGLTRDPLWGLSGFYDLSTLALTLTQIGVASRYLAPEASHLMNHVLVFLVCTQVALATLLLYQLVQRFASRRWVAWPYGLAVLIYPVELWFISQGWEASALRISNLAVLILSMWGLGVCFSLTTRTPCCAGASGC